ncbi:uncharacterized protein [Chelonus insularis]|uniref:uncharacterized protein n=1 Tax=Chelonus insularis TaxID=460826 RepID=UPI00158AE66A|nr:uncharacterized protein LOC118068203 [Chelonus insularis]XP_034941318.1 uncharacterized protein LOC118068203 [Chelonus insularis]
MNEHSCPIRIKMKDTGSVVHAAMVKYRFHDRISYELQQFSLELLHQDELFTGYGVFPLNNSLIITIFSVVMLRTMMCGH